MKTSISVKSDLKDWESLKNKLLVSDDKELRIGFFQEDTYGPENNNLPVAAVAAWQDLGAPFNGPQHIPPRPFMRIGLRDILKSKSMTDKYKETFTRALANKGSLKLSYSGIAKTVVPELKKVIDDWTTPPNAPSTIEQKGKNDPLVDTGKMRDSVKAKITTSVKHQRPLF